MKKTTSLNGVIFEDEKMKVFFSNKNSNELLNNFKNGLVFSHQVHGVNIINTSGMSPLSPFSLNLEADGLESSIQHKNAIGIQTADCVPCFLSSEKTLLSLHLGWRSLAHGLLDKALLKFSKEESIKLFIGPHIHLSSFECGLEVLDIFKENHEKFSNWYDIKGEKALISLSTVIKQKCSGFNLKTFEANIDTFTSKEYFSFRRSQKEGLSTKGRNISLAYFK